MQIENNLIDQQNKVNQIRRTKDLIKSWVIQNISLKLWNNYGGLE